MKLKNIKSLTGMCFLFIVVTFSSCDDFGFPVDSNFFRLFSSVTFSAGNITATSADLTFSKVPGAEKYLIEISEDSLQFVKNVRSIELKADTLKLIEGSTTQFLTCVANLKGGVQYSARLKAVNLSEQIPDSKWDVITFLTKSEQIFMNVVSSEKTDVSVTLRWVAGGSDVTRIELVSMLNGSVITVDLTAEDKAASMKLIEGLTGSTTYTANIYNDDNKRGSISFRTNESVPTDGTILRLVGGEDLYTLLKAQSGDVTVVLPAGSTYITSWTDPATSAIVYSLPISDNISSLTFWGVEGGAKPVINCTSIKVGAGLTKIKLKNIEYHGNSSSADYFMNESVTRSLSTIEFDDCKIHTMRGVLRMQNDANYTTIDKVSFNNCIINNIGGYGLTNTGVANVKLLNLEITNCTLYDMTDALGNFKNVANSVLIDACTFYNCFNNGKYILNFNTTFSPTSLVISNSIFGKINSTILDGTQMLRATNPKITSQFMYDSYKTSDCFVSSGYPMTGIIEYANTSDALFVNPATYDFRIKDLNFSGISTAGDPRWK